MTEPTAMATPGDHPSAQRVNDETETEPPPGRHPGGLELDTVVEAGDWSAAGVLASLVADVARAMAADAALTREFAGGAEACIAFTGDAQVRSLNAQYRGQDKATNVLSFAAGGPPPGFAAQDLAANGAAALGAAQTPMPRFLGDVVLASETVTAEAAEQGIPLGHHIQHLVVHGVLHLLGFDHETDADAVGMETRERLILATLGIADPYSHND